MAPLVAGVAVVHDFLTQFGGAERVAIALARTFPGAPLFTSLYGSDTTYAELKDFEIHTMPLVGMLPKHHFRLGAPFYGFGFELLKLNRYEKVVVSSSSFAHHIRHDNAFVYCHTPPRFIYDLDHYTSSEGLRLATKPLLGLLRSRDKAASNRHVNYVANSHTTAQRIAEHYDREVPVIHPPLDVRNALEALASPPAQPKALVVARLQPYKRIDIAIEACARVGVPLTIVGDGPERARLEHIAEGHDVTFVSGLTDAELAVVMSRHTALLVPGIEDYGMTPLEANYAGRPVVGRAEGGVAESVTEGVNGHLVSGEEVGDWADALDRTLRAEWQPQALRDVTVSFQLPAFQAAIRKWVGEAEAGA